MAEPGFSYMLYKGHQAVGASETRWRRKLRRPKRAEDQSCSLAVLWPKGISLKYLDRA